MRALNGTSEERAVRSDEGSRVRLKAGLGGFNSGGKKGLGPGAVHAGPRLYRKTRPGVSQLPIWNGDSCRVADIRELSYSIQ